MWLSLFALLGSLSDTPSADGRCSPLAETRPAQEHRTILLQSYGMPQQMVFANTIDRVTNADYRQMEVVAPDARTALHASETGHFTFYTTWAARGLLKREMRDETGRIIAAFSYPDDQIAALMQALPGDQLVIDQLNLTTREQSRIAVRFAGCQWIATDSGRYFARVFEKSEQFLGARPDGAALRVYFAEELGRIVQEETINHDAGLIIIDTR